jgi:hypothetical protein
MRESQAAEPAPGLAVTTRTCTLWMEGPLLRGRFLPGAEVELADARENLEASARLIGGRAVPVLVDLRPVKSQSAEARALLAGPDAGQVGCAVALVIGSPLSRVLGSFYLRFNRPGTPTRLFASVEEAERWLLSLPPAEAPDAEDAR